MEQVDVVVESVRSFLMQLGEFLPKLLGVVVILVVGWLVAKLLAVIVVRGLKLVNFNVITERAGLDGFLRQGGVRKSTIDILGILVYWLVILVTLLAAFNTLGLTVVSDLFSKITLFIPHVIVAVLILAIGLYFARFVADAVTAYAKNVGIEDGVFVGRAAYYAIMVFVVLIALDQVQVGGEIVRFTYYALLGGAVLALAIAFGLGGQKWASGQIEKLTEKKKK
ncbi:MAG: hypothetical protein EPN55_08140 [Gammaproteobacteria bacterium]|nr:MAG: hypothetical protein EPN55_08140 [Gammaproteobacteria bacterium]